MLSLNALPRVLLFLNVPWLGTIGTKYNLALLYDLETAIHTGKL